MPRVSPLSLYWAGLAVFVLCVAVALVWPDKYAPVGEVLVGGYLLFGPSCPHCFHYVIWDRDQKNPDNWRFYRPRLTLNTRCGRCGRDLAAP